MCNIIEFFFIVQPTRFSEIASHAVCSVPSAADNDRLNIQVSIIPEGQNGEFTISYKLYFLFSPLCQKPFMIMWYQYQR